MATESLTELPVTRIRPTHGWRFLNLRELWEYRELIYFLTWRDIKVRYKQTAIGAAWAIIQPFFTMVVFSLFFGKLARIPSEGLPYPIFAYSALVPWTYFANSLTQATNSLVGHQQTITKIYFPRVILPLSSILGALVDFVIAFAVLVGMVFFYHHKGLVGLPVVGALWTIPLFVLLSMITAFGVGLWLSALNVQYRDVRYAVPFLIQLWLFATPIAYPMTIVPERWRALYGLNPMVGVIEGFRRALLGKGTIWGPSLTVSVLAIMVIIIGGIFYFRKMEQTFADVV